LGEVILIMICRCYIKRITLFMGFHYKNDHRVVICIPAYNEAKTIGDIIRKAKSYASYIIVYDDGSTDNTREEAEAGGANLIIRDPANKGYGVAIRALLQVAHAKNADIVVTLDSDGQHDPDQIPAVIEPIVRDGFDLVIGSRYLRDSDREKVPKYRSLGIKTITRVTQYTSYSDITDAQSGFRAYGRQALSMINLFEEGMAVSTEILLRAKEKNLLIKEVPVSIEYHREDNPTSAYHTLAHGLGVLYGAIRFVSFRHPMVFYGLPGLVLLIISVLFISFAFDLWTRTRFVSTNMILISVGAAVVGVVLSATSVILSALIALLKGRRREDFQFDK
jgi:glycosyltransferase involved in cell wall biosynthesis